MDLLTVLAPVANQAANGIVGETITGISWLGDGTMVLTLSGGASLKFTEPPVVVPRSEG